MLEWQIVTLNLGLAMVLGALIGSERQVRQRMAGLRTNALVALGAAGFFVFSSHVPGEVSATRVAAQVVSGIGFLGAGFIFRDGFNVHGLNTAATLWCSAAVGLMAGSGQAIFAVILTGFVVVVNLGLRPLVKWIKRNTRAGVPLQRQIRVCCETDLSREGEARALILRTFSLPGLHVAEMNARSSAEQISLEAVVTAEGLPDQVIEHAVHRLLAEPGLSRVQWQNIDEV
ncbi:MAG: MgtC/SapB family protein [Deltaproteobacteria bacterium]